MTDKANEAFGDYEESTDSDSLNVLIALGNRLEQLEKDLIPAAEEALKRLSDEARELKQVKLPSMMTTLRLVEFRLESGAQIVKRQVVRAALPAQGSIEKARTNEERELLQHRLQSGLSWLRTNDGGALIKNNIIIEVGKGKDNEVSEILTVVKEHGFNPVQAESVHPSSLSSFIKEKLQLGAAVPMDVFAVYAGDEASVNRPRKFGNAN